MSYPDPLPLEWPEELSDETVAQLLECLYELARALENRYYAQLQRYHHPDDPQQPSLWGDEPTPL
ncbi:MAG: hypothetical protein GWN84_06805 [Gammaproteobacteria bacterium]|nr:hypothetical protein [Gammaproteobacteria bacterium]NIR82610.1 hypothetical protein [Gammaproteobacteria bacterium]NIR88969.1 hypothetical protein [Gammaproteobacteria bacterium]NIU03742.1 hypothetical protein [Gammaproteobacteria bacterium]NIV74172.1 hypothetical protein [Gammaproteobacteria bacterium]